MACVELAATLAPRATHPPGNEASYPAEAFPMCADSSQSPSGWSCRAAAILGVAMALAIVALAAHYFRCHDFFL